MPPSRIPASYWRMRASGMPQSPSAPMRPAVRPAAPAAPERYGDGPRHDKAERGHHHRSAHRGEDRDQNAEPSPAGAAKLAPLRFPAGQFGCDLAIIGEVLFSRALGEHDVHLPDFIAAIDTGLVCALGTALSVNKPVSTRRLPLDDAVIFTPLCWPPRSAAPAELRRRPQRRSVGRRIDRYSRLRDGRCVPELTLTLATKRSAVPRDCCRSLFYVQVFGEQKFGRGV